MPVVMSQIFWRRIQSRACKQAAGAANLQAVGPMRSLHPLADGRDSEANWSGFGCVGNAETTVTGEFLDISLSIP
jgi:hypothetical protein